MEKLEKAKVCNMPMFRALDKIGAYPEYTIFELNNIIYEIVRNEKNYVICIERENIHAKHIKVYKNKLLSNEMPTSQQAQMIVDMITYLIGNNYCSYKYDYDLKDFIKRANKFIYKLFRSESNPFKNIKSL